MTEEEQKMVYGGEICMWGEQTDSSNLDSNVWPRSAAAAEVSSYEFSISVSREYGDKN
jgi:hexosaminidase